MALYNQSLSGNAMLTAKALTKRLASACSHANTDGFACKHSPGGHRQVPAVKGQVLGQPLIRSESPYRYHRNRDRERCGKASYEAWSSPSVFLFLCRTTGGIGSRGRFRCCLSISILIDFQELPIPTDLRDRLTFNAFGDKDLSPLPGTPGRGQGEGPSRRKLPTLTLSPPAGEGTKPVAPDT